MITARSRPTHAGAPVAYRGAVLKTTSAQSGRLSSRFWRLLGASTEKNRSRSLVQVTAAADYHEEAAGLNDEQLRKATGLLKLDDLANSEDIPQFLAIARESAERATGLRPFDVQLLGALRMLAGDVVEMATGEGKTLSGAIAAAGYALAGRHVHVVTINDYLARRDAEWMGPLLEGMGLTVGWITAESTGEQLRQFYNLGVSPIPPNKPNIREDESDRVYITAAAKYDAIVAHVADVHETGQPVLVGTRDVAESEELHERLLRRGVPAVVLNAKNDAEEATVIAEAGEFGKVTVSTQMAGRGTDIRLGGPDESDHDRVAELGGLHVVGTGRHHTERLDNQLRGRSGRQGDPGSSVFFSSWEDDVVAANLDRNKLPVETDVEQGDGRIVSPKAAGMLDHAQRVAEGRMLDVHANTWRYNQLIAQQRAIIVDRRNALLRTATAREELADLAPDRYAELAENVPESRLEEICRLIMLYHLDRGWADHLAYLADIRESIHLRALGRQNPLDEFHRLAVDAFASLAADAIEAAQQTFETANVLEGKPGLDLSNLARPTSTWTYMVNDNPLSDDTLSTLSLPGVFR